MEPVQRIPRYTLLFRTMLKHMAPGDPQRDKLTEADEIASKIALAEADEQTKRAAIFYCLTATIDAFPPDLFSNSRRFIDCIDVEDVLTDTSAASIAASSSSSLAGSLHCTLFLFDDKLVIVKRPGNGEKGARLLSGLDELDKVTKAGGIPAGKKKSGMVCKGVLDVTDVVVTDVGGAGKVFQTHYSRYIYHGLYVSFLQKSTYTWKILPKTQVIDGQGVLFALSLWYILQPPLTWIRRRLKRTSDGSLKIYGMFKRRIGRVQGSQLSSALMSKKWSPKLGESLLLVRISTSINVLHFYKSSKR